MLAVATADRKIRLFAVGELCLPQRGRGTGERRWMRRTLGIAM